MVGDGWTVRLPTSQEDELERRFRVIKYYLVSLAEYLTDLYPNQEQLVRLVQELRGSRSYQRLQHRQIPTELVERYLSISWTSEMQMRLGTALEPSTLRYSNAWAPVHAYYAIYMSLQAWFAVNGMGHLVGDHTKSLKTVSSMIADRGLLPSPLDAMCSGCPQYDDTVLHRFPDDQDIDFELQLLSTPSPKTFWSRLARMLEATRRRRLDRNFDEWKKSRGRKRMLEAEKRAVAARLHPTTIFDFLWRLRIRSNYKDVSTYITWNVPDFEQEEFLRCLTVVTTTLCTLIETLVVGSGAGRTYDLLASRFLDSSSGIGRASLSFLDARRNLLLG